MKKVNNKRFYDQVARAYTSRNFSRSRIELLEKLVKNLPIDNQRVLDVGCGPGRDLMWLMANGVGKVRGR